MSSSFTLHTCFPPLPTFPRLTLLCLLLLLLLLLHRTNNNTANQTTFAADPQSAIEFILNVDGSMLSCDTEEFDSTLAKNMERLLAEEEATVTVGS